MVACLCWGGWFEEYGMMLSVKEGFLYMEVVQFVNSDVQEIYLVFVIPVLL